MLRRVEGLRPLRGACGGLDTPSAPRVGVVAARAITLAAAAPGSFDLATASVEPGDMEALLPSHPHAATKPPVFARAGSSVAERRPYKADVAGSTPVPPTSDVE